jgi:hypothetical protein
MNLVDKFANLQVVESEHFQDLVAMSYTLTGRIPNLKFKVADVLKEVVLSDTNDRVVDIGCMGFPNQVTFTVRKIEHKACTAVFKIKVFQNGRFQVPGVGPDEKEFVINCLKIITNHLAGVGDYTGDPVGEITDTSGIYHYNLRTDIDSDELILVLRNNTSFERPRWQVMNVVTSNIPNLATCTFHRDGQIFIHARRDNIEVVCAILRNMVEKNLDKITLR